MKVVRVVLILGLFGAGATWAAEPLERGSQKGWVFGVGYAWAPDPYVGDTDQPGGPVPLIGYVGDRLTWMGPYVSYRVSPDDAAHELAVVAQPRFEGADDVGRDPRLQFLKKRDPAFEAGISARAWGFDLTVTSDVSGRHKGLEAVLSTGIDYELTERLTVAGGIAAIWKNQRLADYYFGVDADEQAPGLASYQVDDALSYSADIGFQYRLTDRWTLMLEVGQEWFANTVRNSPLVEGRRQRYAMFGLMYSP